MQEHHLGSPVAASAPAGHADEGATARLKLLCRMLGLENQIPDDMYADPEGYFVIFGCMRSAIEALQVRAQTAGPAGTPTETQASAAPPLTAFPEKLADGTTIDKSVVKRLAVQFGLQQCDAEQEVPHADDMAIDRFAQCMKAKMAAGRAKGRHGWDDETQCDIRDLAAALISHIGKGDPIDVADFAMMLHQRGAPASVLATAWAEFIASLADQWISVADQLPGEPGTGWHGPFLVHLAGGAVCTDSYYRGKDQTFWGIEIESGATTRVTDWQRLPFGPSRAVVETVGKSA